MTEIVRETLPNGLGIIVSEEHSLPIVCCTLWYRVGARNEREGITGISHFLEHMMFKGSSAFPKGAIDEISLRLGGQNNAFTSYDYTCYYMTFSADRWEVALDIEADRMSRLLLDPREFEAEKQVVLEELKMGEDNPWEFLRRNVTSLAYRRHPYRHPIIGWPEDLRTMTPEDMTAYYRRYYQPGNAFFVITGDVSAERVVDRIREKFADLSGAAVSDPEIAAESAPDGRIHFRAARPSQVSRFMMAFAGPSVRQADIHSVNMLRYVLAEGKTSRLYQRLVEQDQTASSLSVYFEDMRDPGLFLIGAELRDGVSFEAVESALREELDKVAQAGVEDDELARALRQCEADYVFEQEDISSLALNLGLYECIDSSDFFLDFLQHARRLTPADLRTAAQRYLDHDRCVVGCLEGRLNGDRVGTGDDEVDSSLSPVQGLRTQPDSTPVRFRTKVPTGGGHAGVGINLPVEQHRLENGLTVLLCPLKRIPAVTLSAVVLAGAREDQPGSEGLAYLLGNMLDEGTTARSHHDIAAFIDRVGGNLDTFGAREGSGATMKLLREDLADGLDLLRELVFDSVFPADRLELARSQMLTRLASLEDRPDYIGSREFSRIIYEGTPLASPTMGTSATVGTLRQDQLFDFYRRYYHPANTVLILVGDLDRDDVLARVRDTWGTIPGGSAHVRRPLPLHRQTRPIRRRIRVQDKEQLHIYLGHLGIRRNNPDYYRLLVLDVILGGGPGFTSRIPRRLRDDLGLAYSTYAGICSSAGLDEGRFTAYIGTSEENRDVAVENMLAEIGRIREEKVTDAELTAARDYLTGSFVFKFETMGQIASFMMAALIHNLGFDYTEKFPELIRGVTAEDVLDVARRYLDTENYTLVEVWPEREER